MADCVGESGTWSVLVEGRRWMEAVSCRLWIFLPVEFWLEEVRRHGVEAMM